MKCFIYLILIVAFFMFYESNPVYAVVIVIILIGLFLLYKRKKSIGNGGGLAFRSGRNHQGSDLFNLMLMQQLINSSGNYNSPNLENTDRLVNERELEIEEIKKDILEIFDK